MTAQGDRLTFPMQVPQGYGRDPGQLGRGPYLAAYEVYCHVYGEQKALVEGGCRGGLGAGEVIAFLYARSFPKSEWRARSDEAFKDMKGISS